ncbi:BTB/POZ domain-containing protein [Zea mays]|uniref:BTB/POZ domain-containing protein n=1 Tax=Zea mays TaxID=4577 RepID=A0A1D6JBZ5_MAIZE|nr:BTB/POZ domain-containing protein [Zea mays]
MAASSRSRPLSKLSPSHLVPLDLSTSWCCTPHGLGGHAPHSSSSSSSSHPSSPARAAAHHMDPPPTSSTVASSYATPPQPSYAPSYPTSYTKFNSALNAGLLNPMSPPPLPLDKTRSSPTLFDMMANEQDCNGGNSSGGEEVLLRLLQVVLEGKDEKARREMKGLVSKMLRENSTSRGGAIGGDLRKESLYSACNGCLSLLCEQFVRASEGDHSEVARIARQADNLHWMLDILVERQIAEDFLRTWATQTELAAMHRKVPAIHRYEVSRVTARLFVGVGKGQILVSKEARCQLLSTWLEPFYEDFGWMRRACKGLDRHLIEDGLANTILTLPLATQQEILLAWFNRFLNSGEDCPNIQRGFEVWWRRAFWKRNSEPEPPSRLRITAICENS